MSTKGRVLLTGGAGFVGSFIAEDLIEAGYEVTIYDNLDPQVHGAGCAKPPYMPSGARFIRADIRDREALKKALFNCDYLSHQAAAVGVGQSMYKIEHYVSVNTLGTALLLDILANDKPPVKKMMVASSMSIYGEGAYSCPKDGRMHPRLRENEALAAGRWELVCPICGAELKPLPTPESKPLDSTSVYAISKKDQEELCLNVGRAYNIPAVALRYFNIYGSRQALSNPYTGVAAIFSSRLLNNHAPYIFEDGLQSRDFTHVSDIVRAHRSALENPAADYEVFNVGTGRSTTILDIARTLAQKLDRKIEPEICAKFRQGDIRHCFADISKITEKLGFSPKVRFEDGIEELVAWVRQETANDMVDQATDELQKKGLIGQ